MQQSQSNTGFFHEPTRTLTTEGLDTLCKKKQIGEDQREEVYSET